MKVPSPRLASLLMVVAFAAAIAIGVMLHAPAAYFSVSWAFIAVVWIASGVPKIWRR
jgi:hypothetical protein